MPTMDSSPAYIFPSIRGVQAGHEYYVSMCALRFIPRIFHFDDEELLPELRAQRTLNKARIPEIASYIINNPSSYVFSAITASIDGDVLFEPFDANKNHSLGILRIPMESRFIINDGQHRRAAIEYALKAKQGISDDTIAVVFFVDIGLNRCQQMFADLNRHAIRPSKSLGVLYDQREEDAILAKNIALRSRVFKDVVELERSTLSARSRKLFTLSSIYFATRELLENINEPMDKRADIALSYWDEIAKRIPEWAMVRDHKITSGEVRSEFIHVHGITLQALGRLGNALLTKYNKTWKNKVKGLGSINWSRSNARLWEGRAMIGGRISKSSQNITLTTNAIKKHLSIELTPAEQHVEDFFLRSEDAAS
jgi:DNA sulfur modification protein DndB